MLICLSAPCEVLAQSLALSDRQPVVGAKIQANYFVPDVEDQLPHSIGLRKKGFPDYYWRNRVPNLGSGVMQLTAPVDPGSFEAVLHDENGAVKSRVAFETIVTPTPGALRTDKISYIVGEKISLAVRLDDNRYYAAPWVGFFRQGSHAEGGASLSDQRLTWQRAPSDGSPLEFTAPADAGVFEFRLFDRDRWHYVLDRVSIEVTVPPTPGVMRLEKDIYTVGEPLIVVTELKDGRYYASPWLGLFKADTPAPGGATVDRSRLTWQRVDRESGANEFTTPADPGIYEFRLYDRDAHHYLLDTVSFEVVVPPTPGVMTLEKDVYIVGEPLTVTTQLVEGRYYASPWVGLFKADTPAPGGATADRSRLAWQRVDRESGNNGFTTPADPGRYEFRLYDRDAHHYLLDTVSFEVEVPPTPGVMELEKDVYTVGEPLIVATELEDGRYYASPWLGLFKADTPAPGGATTDRSRLTWQRVDRESGANEFTTPAEPGIYEFRLYDRDALHYLLDTVRFEVEVPPTPGVMSLEKDVYTVGESLAVTTYLEEGRYYASPWVGLFKADTPAPGGATADRGRLAWQRVNRETGINEFVAPRDPGRYEFRVYDRDALHYLLDTIAFEVRVPPGRGLIALEKWSYRPGELVQATVQMPEDRHLGGARIDLVRSSHTVTGGALVAETRLNHFRVSADTPTISFDAPEEQGPYELRFYDRDSTEYILEIRTFEVRDQDNSLTLSPLRLTPMPEGSSAGTTSARGRDPVASGDPSSEEGRARLLAVDYGDFARDLGLNPGDIEAINPPSGPVTP